jgi:hypothetical protein
MKKVLLIIIVIAASLAYLFWPEKVINISCRCTGSEQPEQKNLNENKVWQIDEFNFKALAEYKIKARVLSRNTFSVGKESKISPLDLVLGWGPMSDQSVIDRIQVTQRNRWYHWKTDSYPIPMK